MASADPTRGVAAAPDALYPAPRHGAWTGFPLAADAAVRQLNERLGMDLWLVTHVVGDEQVVVASAGHWAELAPPGTALSWRESFCVPMVERRGPAVAADVLQFPGYASIATGIWAQVRAYLGVPLVGEDGALFGTLCAVAGSRQPQTLSQSLGAVEFMGQMLSTILAHEQMAKARSAEAAAAYALAERDRLTGQLNRRGWDAALLREDQRLQRNWSDTSVLVVDVDDLKAVNDTSGHEAGDDLLIRCARVMAATSRPGDVHARLGGDEFALLAIECDALDAHAVAASLRVGLHAAGVSASIGTATRRTGEVLAETTDRADAAMCSDRLRRRRAATPTASAAAKARSPAS